MPEGYRLSRDPDVLSLLGSDGDLVAAFSIRGATDEAIEGAAWEAHGGHGRDVLHIPARRGEDGRPGR